jgi:hypothetical protein
MNAKRYLSKATLKIRDPRGCSDMSQRPADIWSAHVYAALGVLSYLFGFLISLGICVWFWWAYWPYLYSDMTIWWWPIITIPVYYVAAGITAIALFEFIIFLLVYITTLKRIDEGRFESAKTPCLFWAIVSLLTGSLFASIFFFLAYTKAGELTAKYGPVAIPALLVPTPPPIQTCPNCGNPLTYDAKAGRWYCGICSTYL